MNSLRARPSGRPGWGLVAFAICWIAALSQPMPAQAQQSPCGAIYGTGHYGPYDYRTHQGALAVVDQYHFTPQVEALVSGESGTIGGDLDYVLKAGPNHHRALVAVVRLADKKKVTLIPGMQYSVECYFDRAIRFAPDDVVVHVLYAQFLGKRGRTSEAMAQLEVATTLAGDDAFTHYNIGLTSFQLHDYERALTECWRARQLGFEKDDLETLLKRDGKWRDPPADLPAAAASEPASSAVAN